jgi:SOS-response transcriptional repressor LexA
MYDELARRTKEVLKRIGLSPGVAGEKSGLTYDVIWKMSRGRRVSVATLRKFAEAFGENPGEWIALGHPELAPLVSPVADRVAESGAEYGVSRKNNLPVLGRLREKLEEQSGEFFPCSQEQAALADYVIRVESQALFPLLLAGDYAAVKSTGEAQAGQTVLAKINDNTVMARYAGRREGLIVLESVNPIYPPIKTDAASEIIGVVVWLHRPAETLQNFGK